MVLYNELDDEPVSIRIYDAGSFSFYAEEDKIYYGAEEVSDQAQALWDAGLTGGFMTWNIACDPYRYDYISWAWAKDYAHSDGTIYRR